MSAPASGGQWLTRRGAVTLLLTALAGAGVATTAPDQLPRRRTPVQRRAPVAPVTQPSPTPRAVVLDAAGGIPPHLLAAIREPLALAVLPGDVSLVFDRRGHAVHRIDRARDTTTLLVSIGGEAGRVLEPTAFSAAADGRFAVADGPNGRERVQVFSAEGRRLSGFTLPGRGRARVAVGSLVLNGVGAMHFTGERVLLNLPETGALLVEYSPGGVPLRSIGTLRRTGHEDDSELHLALNAGIPLQAADGGFWFVFLTGRPELRRYDAAGVLQFERVIQGRELDPVLAALPTTWPRRAMDGTAVPLVTPVVRTAAVSSDGRLWVTLTAPVTYVYDPDGEKAMTVQFRAAGMMLPTGLTFTSAGRIVIAPGGYEFQRPASLELLRN